MPYCKACFEAFKPSVTRGIFCGKNLLCKKCISSIIYKLEWSKYEGVKTLFLSDYDGVLKSWLLRYKEKGDLELAPCFLEVFIPYIKAHFLGDTFIPLPSSKSRIERRGFSHLEEMCKAHDLKYLSCLVKADGEQKKKLGIGRCGRQDIDFIGDRGEIENKNVVLFDDVMTSGSTFKEALEVIKELKPKRIRGLILMDNRRTEERRISL